MPYGAIDPLAVAARYTSVNIVKSLLGIPAANSNWDTRILEAIISAEYALDVEMGHSFPDTQTDPLDEHQPIVPEVVGIPQVVKTAAADIAVAVYKASDAPGIAGGDDLIGTLDVSEIVRREIDRNPLLRSFRISWGLA